MGCVCLDRRLRTLAFVFQDISTRGAEGLCQDLIAYIFLVGLSKFWQTLVHDTPYLRSLREFLLFITSLLACNVNLGMCQIRYLILRI